MMYEDDFDTLSEHLQEVRPIFDDFCGKHGFVYVPRLAIGRYPRIRISRERLTTLYFDLQMELDEKGHRFETFRRNLPYALYAGASIVYDNGTKYGMRFQKGIICFSGKPFDQVSAVLQTELQVHLRAVEEWNEKYLKDNGEKVQLGT